MPWHVHLLAENARYQDTRKQRMPGKTVPGPDALRMRPLFRARRETFLDHSSCRTDPDPTATAVQRDPDPAAKASVAPAGGKHEQR
jgi:hypothetical protein